MHFVNFKALKRIAAAFADWLPSLVSAVTLLLLFSTSHPLFAQSSSQQEIAAWQALRDGKAVALMRHALAPGVGDPSNFEPGNCNTQRNLSQEGREQAGRIGAMLRSNGIMDARVISSEWCRCEETAKLLGVGEVSASAMLNSFFQDRRTAAEQTDQLLESVQEWIRKENGPMVLVTHQVNISAFTNEFTSSGETLIVTLREGAVQVLFRIPGS